MAENETLELFGKWNREISTSTDIEIDKVIREGKPPEEAVKMALVALLKRLAERLEFHTKLDDRPHNWFPMEFPMRMTLKSDLCLWDFELILTLKNRFGIEEEKEDG